MEILNQFGFDIKLFAAQIVNFLVIAYLFKRFLYKPILSVLAKRNETIKKSLLDAEKASKAYEKAEEQKDEILTKARKEAEKMMQEAKAETEKTRDEMMEKTREDISKMLNNAKEQIALEHENFKREAKEMSLEISKKILTSTIEGLFNKKEKEDLVKRSLDLLKNDKQTKN